MQNVRFRGKLSVNILGVVYHVAVDRFDMAIVRRSRIGRRACSAVGRGRLRGIAAGAHSASKGRTRCARRGGASASRHPRDRRGRRCSVCFCALRTAERAACGGKDRRARAREGIRNVAGACRKKRAVRVFGARASGSGSRLRCDRTSSGRSGGNPASASSARQRDRRSFRHARSFGSAHPSAALYGQGGDPRIPERSGTELLHRHDQL